VRTVCCRFDASKSTKGASKLRRDLIDAQVANLPLPPSTRQRLSQLQLMALVCVYVRKANYFQQGQCTNVCSIVTHTLRCDFGTVLLSSDFKSHSDAGTSITMEHNRRFGHNPSSISLLVRANSYILQQHEISWSSSCLAVGDILVGGRSKKCSPWR
jgi:hypothetical protein